MCCWLFDRLGAEEPDSGLSPMAWRDEVGLTAVQAEVGMEALIAIPMEGTISVPTGGLTEFLAAP